MNASVGVLELDAHGYLIPPICKLASRADRVTVFTTAEIYRDVGPAISGSTADSTEWVLKYAAETFGSYLDRVEAICSNEIDVLLVLTPRGTVVESAYFVDFAPDCATLPILHVTNFHASSRKLLPDRLAYPLFRTVRTLPVLQALRLLGVDIIDSWRLLSIVLPYTRTHWDGVIVFYPPVAEHVAESSTLDMPVHSLFPVVHERCDRESAEREAHDSSRLRVTIPGRVTNVHRAYDLVFDCLEAMGTSGKEDVELTLLGPPIGASGRRLIERCRTYNRRGYDVQYFPDDQWIASSVYESTLRRSDVLLAPVRLRHEFSGTNVTEFRGVTMTTGNIHDAIHYGIPLVLPHTFPVDPIISDLVTTYSDEESLANLLTEFLNDSTVLVEQRSDAEACASQFGLENQQRRFESIVSHFV